MTTPAPQAAPKTKRERTREKLLAAALAVAEEKGFEAASLDEIAIRAGMTKGAIYSNFEGKSALMLAAVRSRSKPFSAAYEAGAPLATQMRIVARAIAAMLPQVQREARLQAQFHLYLQREPALQEAIANDLAAELEALIRRVARHHAAELAVPARVFVLTAQVIGLGFAHQAFATPSLVTEAAIVSAFDLLVRGALKPETRSAVPT